MFGLSITTWCLIGGAVLIGGALLWWFLRRKSLSGAEEAERKRLEEEQYLRWWRKQGEQQQQQQQQQEQQVPGSPEPVLPGHEYMDDEPDKGGLGPAAQGPLGRLDPPMIQGKPG